MTKKQLEEEIESLESDLMDWKEKYSDIKEVRDEADQMRQKLDWEVGRRNNLENEVEWYRKVLELIFVPADKIGEINKLRDERQRRGF